MKYLKSFQSNSLMQMKLLNVVMLIFVLENIFIYTQDFSMLKICLNEIEPFENFRNWIIELFQEFGFKRINNPRNYKNNLHQRKGKMKTKQSVKTQCCASI